MNTPLLRPEPVAECGARSVDSSVPAVECARSLVGGDFLRVVDHYRTGVVILEEVHRLLGLDLHALAPPGQQPLPPLGLAAFEGNGGGDAPRAGA